MKTRKRSRKIQETFEPKIIRETGNGTEFLGYVPYRISPTDKGYEPKLRDFPRNLLLCGERKTEEGTAIGYACYWFTPKTFSERPAFKQMRYLPEQASPYSVLVRYETKRRIWKVTKYRGRNIAGIASSPELDWAMGLAGRFGVQDDEPVDELQI